MSAVPRRGPRRTSLEVRVLYVPLTTGTGTGAGTGYGTVYTVCTVHTTQAAYCTVLLGSPGPPLWSTLALLASAIAPHQHHTPGSNAKSLANARGSLNSIFHSVARRVLVLYRTLSARRLSTQN